MYAPGEDVARLTYFGLHALQHRGQESAGIAVSDGSEIVVYRNLGLVAQVFNERILDGLHGDLAIGHTRYSTTGASGRFDNAQPSYCDTAAGGMLALGHNGNLVNTLELATLAPDVEATSDSALVAALIARANHGDMIAALRDVLPKVRGAYSFVLCDEQSIYGVRDPHGVRPLVLGRLPDGGWVLASETCALEIVDAAYIRDIAPGEIVRIDQDGPVSHEFAEPHPRLCVFEYVYVARPDSILYGRGVSEVRRAMGKQLADEAPADVDLVIPVPESAVHAAQGYADRSGIPYADGFVKNRYVGRTFIQPTQAQRQMGVRMKYNPLPSVIEGKRLVVVEDSIVRATTSKAIVEMLRKAGAKEVHLRIASPPIRWPCFYGLDFPSRDELIGAKHEVDEICEIVGADSLEYLSLDGMLTSTGAPTERFCHACFSGGYPIDVPPGAGKDVLEP